MPFIALCPHCRSAKVQAPTRKRGQKHACPKCKAEFELVPMEESAVPVDYKLPPVEFDLTEAYRESEDDFARARTAVVSPAAATLSETPSEVMPVVPPPPEVKAAPAVSPAYDYSPSPKLEPPMVMVLIAGGLFGLAIIATQFNYGRIIAIPLLLIGLLLGMLATPGLIEGHKKYGWTAIGINVLGLILVLFMPSWLGVSEWVPLGDPNDGPKPALSVPRNGGSPSQVPAEGVDAQHSVWMQDGVKVEVAAVKLEMDKSKKPKWLRITLKASYSGVDRAVSIKGWPPETPLRLSLASGPAVNLVKIESDLPRPLLPGKEVEVKLLFDVPPMLNDVLILEMPGSGFDSADPVKFRISSAMIGR